MDQPDNELVFTGQLLKIATVRTTPAGIRVARFVLTHRSRRKEAGQWREVQCRLSVVASGERLTAGIAEYSPGTWLTVKGFLSRAGYRAADTRVELHALEMQPVTVGG